MNDRLGHAAGDDVLIKVAGGTGMDPIVLLGTADEAMYAAKQARKRLPTAV